MTVPEQDREPVPAALREAVKLDLAPVVTLPPPWRRALALALPTLIVLAAAIFLLSRREGAADLFSLAGGGVSVLEWLGGLGLVWLALREAVPGLGVGAVRSMLALAGGVGLQLALGFLIWQRTGAGLTGPGALAAGARCATIEGAIGLPHLAIATWLALRALPIRPRWSGALAGAAAGLLADGIWHLACSRNDLEHLLVWHFGATVAMMLVGAVTGSFWTRRPRRIR
jgi:Negative regulator of sigma F